MEATLFLIPVTLGETEHRRVLPAYNREVILQLRHFIVENVRTARRFLKRVDPAIVIDELTFCPCPPQALQSGSAGRPLLHPAGCDGLRFQWTEFCLPRLSAD